MARPHTDICDLPKVVHIAWLAVMRASIKASAEGRYSAATDLEQICLELHRVHEALLKRHGSLRSTLRVVEPSSAQLRIDDLL